MPPTKKLPVPNIIGEIPPGMEPSYQIRFVKRQLKKILKTWKRRDQGFQDYLKFVLMRDPQDDEIVEETESEEEEFPEEEEEEDEEETREELVARIEEQKRLTQKIVARYGSVEAFEKAKAKIEAANSEAEERKREFFKFIDNEILTERQVFEEDQMYSC